MEHYLHEAGIGGARQPYRREDYPLDEVGMAMFLNEWQRRWDKTVYRREDYPPGEVGMAMFLNEWQRGWNKTLVSRLST